jgi:hypothetical protein
MTEPAKPLAYATRRIESIPAAKTILLGALKKHSNEAGNPLQSHR